MGELKYGNGEAVTCPECGVPVHKDSETWTGKTNYKVCSHMAKVIEEAVFFHVGEDQE